eukprot:4281732-Amphidinium_carterae.4
MQHFPSLVALAGIESDEEANRVRPSSNSTAPKPALQPEASNEPSKVHGRTHDGHSVTGETSRRRQPTHVHALENMQLLCEQQKSFRRAPDPRQIGRPNCPRSPPSSAQSDHKGKTTQATRNRCMNQHMRSIACACHEDRGRALHPQGVQGIPLWL